MMDKKSNESVPCTYCDNPALPNTDPPVCAEHADKQNKEASGDRKPESLKELDCV